MRVARDGQLRETTVHNDIYERRTIGRAVIEHQEVRRLMALTGIGIESAELVVAPVGRGRCSIAFVVQGGRSGGRRAMAIGEMGPEEIGCRDGPDRPITLAFERAVDRLVLEVMRVPHLSKTLLIAGAEREMDSLSGESLRHRQHYRRSPLGGLLRRAPRAEAAGRPCRSAPQGPRDLRGALLRGGGRASRLGYCGTPLHGAPAARLG
jgi:hypothetical protein